MSTRKKIILLAAYILTLAAILWHPVTTVKKIEFPAEAPTELKFKVTVVDPYDPMRGRYVRLDVQPDKFQTSDKKDRFRENRAWAVLEKGPDGFARVVRLEPDREKVGKTEIAVRVNRLYFSSNYKDKKGWYHFRFPFERFYLNELKAPELEAELRNRSRAKQYMILHVNFFRNGRFAVTKLSRAPSK